MLYNVFPKTGIKISAISFGSMRWPSEEVAFKTINRGLDAGINYIDTSTGYIGGDSERWSGLAVKDRRDEINFSIKSHWTKAPSADEVRQTIDKCLKSTGLEYFDFYQLWNLARADLVEQAVGKGGTVEGVRKAQEEGLIRQGVGFTFHGTPEAFRMAIDTGEFICATVSYNLLKRTEEAQIDYAAANGVGVIIMNPLAGGVLGLGGKGTLNFLCEGDSGPAYGALRFLLANNNISTAIVGFTAEGEIDAAVGALSGVEALGEQYRRDMIERMDAAKLIEGDFCTGCGYCKDCPNGFNPTRYMQAIRDFGVYGVDESELAHWLLSKYPHQSLVDHLNLCTECGQCEEKCPQHLGIVKEIRRGKAALL